MKTRIYRGTFRSVGGAFQISVYKEDISEIEVAHGKAGVRILGVRGRLHRSAPDGA